MTRSTHMAAALLLAMLCGTSMAAALAPQPRATAHRHRSAVMMPHLAAHASEQAAELAATLGLGPRAAHDHPHRQLLQKLPANKQLRIWCIGDSMTEGWDQVTYSKHPYTIALQQELQQRLPGYTVTFVNSGIGGAGIQDKIGDAVRGMPAQPFDVAIFMAGINDVKWRLRQAGPVFDSLKQLYETVWKKTGATILAIPPLPTKLCGTPTSWGCDIDQQRKELRAKILAYVKKQQAAGNWKIYAFDGERAFQYWSLPMGTRDSLFGDDVHLTYSGYDKLGSLLGGAMCKMFKNTCT